CPDRAAQCRDDPAHRRPHAGSARGDAGLRDREPGGVLRGETAAVCGEGGVRIVGWAKALLRRAHLRLRTRNGGHADALPTLRLRAMRKTYVLIPAAGFRPSCANSLS